MSSSPHIHIHKKSLLDGVDLTHPICKGYLFKQSHVHKAFNKRFFALYNRVMVYYDNEHEFEKDALRGNFEVCVCVCVCCLLYTSPSPRDATLSRMPSSA